MNWKEIHADQNLRLSQKMLEQQGEINRLKRRVEELENPDGATCVCGREYPTEECPVHGVMRLLIDERAKNASLRAEIEKLTTINEIHDCEDNAIELAAKVEQLEKRLAS